MNSLPVPTIPHTDFKFHPRLTQVGCYWGNGGHTELYLVEGERLAVIDTGTAEVPERYLAPALAAIGRSLADIALVINTHGHHDHAGGNAAVVRASGAEVWLPEGDVEIAESAERQFELYFAQNDRLLGRADRLNAALALIREQAGPRTRVTRPLRDGDRLDLGRGIELTVVHTPGHTRGCSCFYWEREGILFSGDSVLGVGSRPGGLPLIYFPDLYERSLDRVETLDLNLLCLGHHYGSLTLTRESLKWGRAGKQFVRESRQIAHLIRDAMASALADGPRPFLDAARDTTRSLAEPLALQIDQETGLAASQGVAALHAYWKAMTDGRGSGQEV
jgi:glyoxylase-like metal-dependent hydrolase (beta-lactamase superfamily II)